MMSLANVSVLALLSVISVCARADERIELPPTDILVAARKIIHQTGPAYWVEGTLSCRSIASEVPPYRGTETCEITIEVDGQSVTESVENPESILAALYSVKRRSGPAYLVRVPFEGRSMSREFPPYDVSETVEIFADQID